MSTPADPAGVAPQRRSQVADRLAAVRTRIENACARSGRRADEITLIVVTKTHPPADVELLADLGVQDVGENRDQEAAPKHEACAALGLRWHFIGRLQSNKARSVARYADLIHCVDRPPLVSALGRAALAEERELACLVQVSLDGDPARGGCPPSDVPALADAVAGQEGLRLRGLMAVAPLGVDPRAAFDVLPALRDTLLLAHPGAGVVSAGMSGDLEAAVACGATHLRVGTAILGDRPPLR